MFKIIFTAAALAVASSAAIAAPVQFQIGNNSSVTLSNKDGGPGCNFFGCDVNASIAAGLAGTTFDLDEGEYQELDFITFTGSGWGAIDFDITATLDFDLPDVDTTGGGYGGALLLSGNITGGLLTWNSGVPITYDLADGSQVWIDFEDGLTIFDDETVTTSAKIKVKKGAPDPAPIPLPAGALLLVGGLGTLSAFRLRKA